MALKQQTAVSQNSVLIHQSTLKHLDVIEKAILDCLVRQGRAVIVPDEGTP
jgi:hypothetical protein